MKPIYLLLASAACLFLSCKGKAYRAASGSMENTIMAGDMFFVTNTDKFDRNDIAVFENYSDDYNSPIENEPGKFKKKWQRMIYRLVALSGDSIEIRNGELYVNGRNVPPVPSSKTQYELQAKPGPLIDMDEEQLAQAQISQKGDTAIYSIELTNKQANELKKNPAVFSVQRKLIPNSFADTFYARSSAADKWTVDNYGPLRVPAIGEKIQVTSENFNLYRNVPGIETTGEHTIREKLYFFLGDNRHAAMDSRFIGFIAHSKMIGVVKKE